ncbi:MAG: ABC transporter permease, partial [Sphaerochaetaceae bacterium]
MSRTFKFVYKLGIMLVAALAALLMASIILWMIGADVSQTFYTICFLPLTKTLHMTEVLIRAIPLCILA